MKLKIILFLLCLASLNVMGQNDNTQGTISRAKCKTCGKVISQCKYKGKHPAPQSEKTCTTCGKVLSKCQYKGKHPKPVVETCTTCNKPLSQCSYNGKHPEPEAAGYDVTFSCNVPSARLYIDDSSYSNASGTRFLRTGNHSIKATADGYQDYDASITINRQNTVCVITMEKMSEPEKPVAVRRDVMNNQGLNTLSEDQNNTKIEKDKNINALGVQLCEIDDTDKKVLETSYGLKVTKINNGMFRDAGIPINFCIQKVNDKKIKNIDDLNSVLKDVSSSQNSVLYIQGLYYTGKKGYFAVPY